MRDEIRHDQMDQIHPTTVKSLESVRSRQGESVYVYPVKSRYRPVAHRSLALLTHGASSGLDWIDSSSISDQPSRVEPSRVGHEGREGRGGERMNKQREPNQSAQSRWNNNEREHQTIQRERRQKRTRTVGHGIGVVDHPTIRLDRTIV